MKVGFVGKFCAQKLASEGAIIAVNLRDLCRQLGTEALKTGGNNFDTGKGARRMLDDDNLNREERHTDISAGSLRSSPETRTSLQRDKASCSGPL